MDPLILLILFVLFNAQTDPPPGMIRAGRFFVDKSEVSNLDWLEFQHLMAQNDTISPESMQPDSLNFWYENPEYRHAPVVFITQEQAELYCKWRTKLATEISDRRVTYRLPTTNEWSEIATYLIATSEKEVEKELRQNIKEITKYPDEYFLFASNYPKTLEHLFDNVSEMTSDPNIAMGGNINIIPPRQATSQVVRYEKPSAYLGFRCIVVTEE